MNKLEYEHLGQTRTDQELFLIQRTLASRNRAILMAAVVVGLTVLWGAHQVSYSLVMSCPMPEEGVSLLLTEL